MVAARGSQLQAGNYASPSRADAPLTRVPSGATAGRLATLTYQSRAVKLFSEAELHVLLQTAQARNKASNITGLLIYDKGRFFQCLEGPADSLEMQWDAIQHDTRHTDVELLGNASTSTRFFANWDMRLAQSLTSANSVYTDSMYVAPAVVELLYRTPQAAPSILAMLAPSRPVDESAFPDQRDVDRAVLTEVMRRVALPQVAAAHGLLLPLSDGSEARPLEITHLSQLSQLPRLLLAAEPSRAFKLIADAYAQRHSLGELCAQLLEPTARSLGDLWQSDECSELDVTACVACKQQFVDSICPTQRLQRRLPTPTVR